MGIFNWIKNKRLSKAVKDLEKELSDKLGEIFPLMKEMKSNSQFKHFQIIKDPGGIALFHFMNGPFFEKNRKRFQSQFRISGIEVRLKNEREFFALPVTVLYGLISNVEIKNPETQLLLLDPGSIRIVNLKTTDIPIANDEYDQLMKILNGVDEALLNKIECDYTFEIELKNKKYYTILDMEDGNYIALNKKGEVFRLHHDSASPAKKISPSALEFLKNYSGNKEDLAHLFN